MCLEGMLPPWSFLATPGQWFRGQGPGDRGEGQVWPPLDPGSVKEDSPRSRELSLQEQPKLS